MNFEQSKAFEDALRSAKPVKPSPELIARIEQELRAAENRKRVTRWRKGTYWAGLAIAATILVAFGLSLFRSLPVPAELEETLAVEAPALQIDESETREPVFEPVLAQNNLQDRVDEGIVFLKNGLTARKYRYEFIDRVVWRNPSNGDVVEMEVPRDEVVLIPVQTF